MPFRPRELAAPGTTSENRPSNKRQELSSREEHQGKGSPSRAVRSSAPQTLTGSVMGYQLHITRAPEWIEADQWPIELDEWLRLVEQDPDRVLQDSGLPGFVVWTALSQGGAHPPMWHTEGCVVSSAAETLVARKMHQIAQRLGARVVGDDGEEYDAAGEPVGHEAPEPRGSRRPWWKRYLDDQPTGRSKRRGARGAADVPEQPTPRLVAERHRRCAGEV